MLGLLAISIILLVWGFIQGFETKDGVATDVLLFWGYIMVALALVATLVFGLWIGIKNSPKMLKNLGIGLGAAVVIVLGAYLLAPGNPAMGMLAQPSAGTLKLTDTILNLTYLAGGLAIIAIIAGEVRIAINNKK